MANQLYINCSYDQQLQMPPHQLPFPAAFSPAYPPLYMQSQLYQAPQPAGTQPMPIAISPASSGRFDTGSGYVSDSSPPVFQRHIPIPSPPMLTPPPPVAPAAVNALEWTWRDKFVANFSRFPSGIWHLKVVSEPPDFHNTGFARNLWRYRLEKSKVYFICTACRNSTVATGQAVFWIYKDDSTNTGHIHLKLYSQKCPHCQAPAEANWHPSEAARALDDLFDHIAQSYYGVRPAPALSPVATRTTSPSRAAGHTRSRRGTADAQSRLPR